MRTGPLSQQTDDQLVAFTRGGSDDAFAEIVHRYEPVLRAKCTRIAGRSLADDALAQTWLQTLAALRRPSAPPALEPWLHRVAYNCSIDQLRARRQHESLMPPRVHASDSPDTELERKQSLRDLVKGLSTLPENQRDALVLREFEGWSYAQIAEWVEEPPAGIHQLIFRARSALRRGLCALAPWAPLRALLQQLSALAPGGSGGSLRFGLAMIGTALISGGGVTSGVADAPGARRSIEHAQHSTAEVVREVAPAGRRAESRGRPLAVLPASAGPRTGASSLPGLVWMADGPTPDAAPELVAEEPGLPELAPAPPATGEIAPPPEPGQGAPDPEPATATASPATDSPGGAVPEPTVTDPRPATDTAPEPATEEPVVADPAPEADGQPGRGDGPPPWAPAKGHGKHVSAQRAV